MEKIIGKDELVWYVAYGSNLSSARFKDYLLRINFQGPFPDSRPFSLPFSIYFDRSSSKWDNKGVAFLDVSKKGFAYGKAYMVTYQQFLKIKFEEGIYPKVIHLGLLLEKPALTFTQDYHSNKTIPSKKYLEVIEKGLVETYPNIKIEIIREYLKNRSNTSLNHNI